MRYSFDPARQASNLKKHGLNLADAPRTEDHIRIISMRKADRHEQAIYRENLT